MWLTAIPHNLVYDFKVLVYVCSCSILSIDSCIQGTVYTRQNECVEIVIFYTEILTGKVVLWCFFTSEMSEKSTIQLFKSKSQYRT